MSLTRGRVLRASAGLAELEPVVLGGLRQGRAAGRRMPARVVEAEERARSIIEAAEERARELVAAAERESSSVQLRAEALGRADGAASVAANAIALAAHEARAEDRQVHRLTQMASVLAERLLGEALALDPGRVAALARQVISEARGARSITIVAHPRDAEHLVRLLEEYRLQGSVARVEVDPRRQPGGVKVVTEIGELDGELAPQVGRLAARLREALSE